MEEREADKGAKVICKVSKSLATSESSKKFRGRGVRSKSAKAALRPVSGTEGSLEATISSVSGG